MKETQKHTNPEGSGQKKKNDSGMKEMGPIRVEIFLSTISFANESWTEYITFSIPS